MRGFKKAHGRFAQLVDQNTTAGGWICLPAGIPEVLRQHTGATAGEALQLMFRNIQLPEEFNPLLDLLSAQAATQIAQGTLDFGYAWGAPNKDGLFTMFGAFASRDQESIEKAIRNFTENAPKAIKDRIRLNARKVAGVDVTEVNVGDLLSEEMKRLLGEKAVLTIAVGKSEVIATLGPNGDAEIQRIMALKPADCSSFDVHFNPEKFSKLLKKANDKEDPFIDKIFGSQNRLLPFYRIDVHGGPEFKIRLNVSMMYIGMFAFIASGPG